MIKNDVISFYIKFQQNWIFSMASISIVVDRIRTVTRRGTRTDTSLERIHVFFVNSRKASPDFWQCSEYLFQNLIVEFLTIKWTICRKNAEIGFKHRYFDRVCYFAIRSSRKCETVWFQYLVSVSQKVNKIKIHFQTCYKEGNRFQTIQCNNNCHINTAWSIYFKLGI